MKQYFRKTVFQKQQRFTKHNKTNLQKAFLIIFSKIKLKSSCMFFLLPLFALATSLSAWHHELQNNPDRTHLWYIMALEDKSFLVASHIFHFVLLYSHFLDQIFCSKVILFLSLQLCWPFIIKHLLMLWLCYYNGVTSLTANEGCDWSLTAQSDPDYPDIFYLGRLKTLFLFYFLGSVTGFGPFCPKQWLCHIILRTRKYHVSYFWPNTP